MITKRDIIEMNFKAYESRVIFKIPTNAYYSRIELKFHINDLPDDLKKEIELLGNKIISYLMEGE